MTTLPPNYLRLSSKWLETNVAPEDCRFYNTVSHTWDRTGWAGMMIPNDLLGKYHYATARTDLPREAYADERAEESKTPEVDAAQKRFFAWLDNESESICPPNGWAIARTMEREVATLRAQLDAKEAEIRQLNAERSSLEMSVKIVKANRDEWKRSWGVVATERDKLRAERRELRELSERRAETIAVAMHNQKVADQDHASTVSSIRSENDKLRAEVEHRAKQRDEFQNLFIEASDGFNQRGEQLARLAAELDAVRKELRNRDESIAAKRKYIEKCNHLPELVIDSESGPICCECWAIEEKSRADKWQTILEANNDLMPTGVNFYFCVEEFFRQVRGMWNEQMDVLRNCGTAIVKAESERDAAQARCGELERLMAEAALKCKHAKEGVKSHAGYFTLKPLDEAISLLTPSQQPDNFDSSSSSTEGRAERVANRRGVTMPERGSSENQASPAVNPSRPEPVKAGEWLPMETAPKRKVLLRIQTSPDAFRTVKGLWINGQWDFDGMLFFDPVGWKPIAPEWKATEGEG